VQYEHFKFESLKTDHFDIYFYPEEKEAAQQAARMAERWYARHKFILQHELNGRQPTLLYASHPQFEQTNALGGGDIGEGTGASPCVAAPVVLPFAARERPIVSSPSWCCVPIRYHRVELAQVSLPPGCNAPVVIEHESFSRSARAIRTPRWMRDAVKSKAALVAAARRSTLLSLSLRLPGALNRPTLGRWRYR
jgi:hypothetical protein